MTGTKCSKFYKRPSISEHFGPLEVFRHLW